MSDFIESLRQSPRPTTAESAFLSIHDAQATEIARLKVEHDAAALRFASRLDALATDNRTLARENEARRAEAQRLLEERNAAEEAERIKDGQLAELQRENHVLRMSLRGEVLKITSEAIREAMPRKDGEE